MVWQSRGTNVRIKGMKYSKTQYKKSFINFKMANDVACENVKQMKTFQETECWNVLMLNFEPNIPTLQSGNPINHEQIWVSC